MAFNSSGVYVPPTNSFAQAVTGTQIDSAHWNATYADIKAAFDTCLCRDGQSTVTANLPMANYRHTGVSNATALTQYATADQVVDNALCYGGASAAGTDTYAVNLAISPGAYAAGQRYSFIADVANTGACTINFSSIGAASIKLQDGTDPYTNAIIANQIVEVEYDGTNMVLLNPEIDPTAVLSATSFSIANGVKAACKFDLAATPTVTNSYNISSITKSGTGHYIVTLSSAMTDTDYSVLISCTGDNASTGNFSAIAETPASTTVFHIYIYNSTNSLSDIHTSARINFWVFE